MTITDAQIEAANAEFDRWDTAVVSAYGKQVEYHVVRGDDAGCYEIVSVHDSHASCIEASERASMRAALEAAEKAAWRPIEEAPRDKTPVLIAVPDRDNTGFIVGEAYFDPENYDGGDWWWAGTSIGDYYADPVRETNYRAPSFFRPLPTPGEPDEPVESI